MRVYEVVVLSAGDASGNLISSAFQLTQMFGAAAACVFSGGANNVAGTLTINGSVDGVNYTPLQNAGTNVTLTVSGNGTYTFDVVQTNLQYLNVTYRQGERNR